MGRLAGKVAIVTGGASGIGRATVERFVAEGASVVIGDLQDDKGKRLAETLAPRVSYRRTDVGEEKDVEALVAQAVDKFGRLDCMFNNAGLGGVGGSVTELALADVEATMRVLFLGVLLGIKHGGRVMRAQRSGSIISTASVAGLEAVAGPPHIYGAAKAAVIHLTRTTAKELGESGVRVNCLCPGFIATPIFGGGLGLGIEASDQLVETLKPHLARIQPIQRTGLPEDIANAALWLASDESSFVNGHALVVDGGLIGGPLWSVAEAQRQQARATFGAAASKT